MQSKKLAADCTRALSAVTAEHCVGETVQPGRLQTQHISATGIGQPAVALQLVDAPAAGVALEHPFTVALRLTNSTERRLGPLHVALADLPTGAAFLSAGTETVTIDDVAPHSSATVLLTLVPTAAGVQTLSGLDALDASGKIVTSLQPASIFVKG